MTTSTSSTSGAIPLTTVFTPPASCTSVNWVSSDCKKSTCEGVYNIVQTTDTDCYPSGWAKTATWFSPGLFCPTGYTVNNTNVVTSGLGITETQARCCPSYDSPCRIPPAIYKREGILLTRCFYLEDMPLRLRPWKSGGRPSHAPRSAGRPPSSIIPSLA